MNFALRAFDFDLCSFRDLRPSSRAVTLRQILARRLHRHVSSFLKLSDAVVLFELSLVEYRKELPSCVCA